MIDVEMTFRCFCPAMNCERQLDAANWETAIAEVRLMHCGNGVRERYIICNVVLTEYDEEGRLSDLDLVSRSWRKVA